MEAGGSVARPRGRLPVSAKPVFDGCVDLGDAHFEFLKRPREGGGERKDHVRASCKLGDTADALGGNGGILADASLQGSAGYLGNARPAPDSRARKRIVALGVPIEADRSATDQGLLPCRLFRRA